MSSASNRNMNAERECWLLLNLERSGKITKVTTRYKPLALSTIIIYGWDGFSSTTIFDAVSFNIPCSIQCFPLIPQTL